jgi:hemoglobin
MAGTGGDVVSESLYERLGGHEGILNLIRPFYADVRQHAVLGPVFNAHIKDWETHLGKIADFWALQAGVPSSYRGGFAGAHLRIGVRPEFFEHWLSLWDFNCQRALPPEEAREMSALAHELGRRLRKVVEGNPMLQIGGEG